MQYNGISFERLHHDCFRINDDVTIYTDPFQIDTEATADIVFISHEHFDHCSVDDLKTIAEADTDIVANENSAEKLNALPHGSVHPVLPDDEGAVQNVPFRAVPAYNTDKYRTEDEVYHPESEGHCGYVFTVDDVTIYFAGDTDVFPAMKSITCDVALLPVSGEYVMTADEAVTAVDKIEPDLAIPMHYGAIVGSRNDAEQFSKGANCTVEILD